MQLEKMKSWFAASASVRVIDKDIIFTFNRTTMSDESGVFWFTKDGFGLLRPWKRSGSECLAWLNFPLPSFLTGICRENGAWTTSV